MVVIVFKHSVKSLGFPKCERLDKGGPKAPDKPLLYPRGRPRIMLLVQLVVIVFKYVVKGLGFPKHERLDKGGPKAPDKPLLYPRGRPRIMLLIQLVVIVFKYVVKGLGFPKYERLDKGGRRPPTRTEGPRQGPKAPDKDRRPPDKPLLYPPEQTSNNVVGSNGRHRVQICCKGSWFS